MNKIELPKKSSQRGVLKQRPPGAFTECGQTLIHELFSDIDECSKGSHGCDVNAYCNNTIGSYTCTCMEKYSGNGKTCASDREFCTYNNFIIFFFGLITIFYPKSTVFLVSGWVIAIQPLAKEIVDFGYKIDVIFTVGAKIQRHFRFSLPRTF